LPAVAAQTTEGDACALLRGCGMHRPRILAIIQAGGAGSRMDVLTRERAKPALPFAGAYQLLDFPLSNLAHSAITDVWLSVQYQASTLEEQVGNGRPWDLDRTRGGLRLLVPQEGSGTMDEEGFAHGNADLLFRIRAAVAAFAPDVLLVLSADHVYRFDYHDAIATHLDADADCTIVTTEVPIDEAGDHAVVTVDDDGRVTDFAYKPDDPTSGVVAAEIFVYKPDRLVETLEDLHRELSAELGGDGDGDTGLGDFGEHLLPRLVEAGEVAAHPLPGYWRDLGEPSKYLQAHQDVLTDNLGIFDQPGWPILTQQPQRVPPRVLDGARVSDSLISPGCRVGGQVERSVLGPGVVIEPGAVVRNSVVFADCVVAADATVDWAIVDRDCRVGSGAVIGDPGSKALDDSDLVVLVGRDCSVGAGVRLEPGARLEPGTTA
jgi:glucose-1-phosphate adenylyltransferase